MNFKDHEHNWSFFIHIKEGNFFFSGRRNSRVGGGILINQDSEDNVLEIIKEDPFYIKGIVKYDLIDFIPSKHAEGFNMFID